MVIHSRGPVVVVVVRTLLGKYFMISSEGNQTNIKVFRFIFFVSNAVHCHEENLLILDE